GLCLSGCEQETTNKALEADLRKLCPNLADTIFVGSDTIGSLSTACRNGGVIVISGTAFWIASRAVKTLFDDEDNLCEAPHSPALLRKLIFEHFNLEDRFGMLPHFYSHFDKQHFASLTAKISKAASSGDELCIHLMKEAGYHLGRHVSSLSRNMDPVMFDTQRGLEVVCSGSVFKSWDLLKPGFVEGIKPRHQKDIDIPRYTLLRLEVYKFKYSTKHLRTK
ncbi:UNVERIFIED_CONTAM: hypothetical protein GTU68_044425, partial [Idotea baltica]|nr:hypothetical protein [Idotea baltica]